MATKLEAAALRALDSYMRNTNAENFGALQRAWGRWREGRKDARAKAVVGEFRDYVREVGEGNVPPELAKVVAAAKRLEQAEEEDAGSS